MLYFRWFIFLGLSIISLIGISPTIDYYSNYFGNDYSSFSTEKLNEIQDIKDKSLTLGLDLQGGIHMVLELDLVDSDGTSHWTVVATIADAVVSIPARYHPAAIAEPSEYGPAECTSSFQLEPDDMPPPVMGTVYDQIQFLDNLNLEWDLINKD